MAIKASGSLSMTEITNEFANATPNSMSEFYGLGTLPASGTISYSNFYGQSSIVIAITNVVAIQDVDFDGGVIHSATVKFYDNGDMGSILEGVAEIDYGDWAVPNTVGTGSSYWIRATKTAGTGTLVGTVGTWQALSTTRQWSMSRTAGFSIDFADVLFEISSSAGGTPVVASGTIKLRAGLNV